MVAIPIIDNILGIADKFIPDPEKKQEFKLQMLNAVAGVDKAQAEINLQNAKSDSWFQSNWRPTLCWMSICIIGWGYFGRDFVNTLVLNYNPDFVMFPAVDPTIMIALLGKLLGFGVYRSVEKVKRAGLGNKLKDIIG